MKKLEAKKDFTLDGTNYIVGDVVKVTDIAVIRKLNEKGFIKPLDYKELIILERELNNKEEV
jgi:hypothetical protein